MRQEQTTQILNRFLKCLLHFIALAIDYQNQILLVIIKSGIYIEISKNHSI